MFCPFAGWCFVLNRRKLGHWEGAPFSQVPATPAMGTHFEAVKSKWTFVPVTFLFKPGRVIGYVWHPISSWAVFSSHSSSHSLVLHSGIFVRKFMVDVELLFRIFISNKLYPALQLVLFNKGVQPDELFPLKLSWQSVGGCSCVGGGGGGAESPCHISFSSAVWLCLVHSWGQKWWTPLLNSSPI